LAVLAGLLLKPRIDVDNEAISDLGWHYEPDVALANANRGCRLNYYMNFGILDGDAEAFGGADRVGSSDG
jgi:hypothetical protein